jgi:dTDP-4-dehydrorhamnose reductase
VAASAQRERGDRRSFGETYHLGGTGTTSWFGFAEHIFAECARNSLPSSTLKPIPTSAYPTRAVRPANSQLDCSKFRNAFGYAMPDWRISTAAVVRRLASADRERQADWA